MHTATRSNISPALRAAFRFFLDNAGYATPPGRAQCALDYARAERDASSLGLHAEWVNDPQGMQDAYHDGRTPETVLGCVIYNAQRQHLASLWQIEDPSWDYRRVVEAELAEEAIAELSRQWVDPATHWDEATQTPTA